MSDVYFIYKIVNTVNEKIYIGCTNNLDKRKKYHFVWKINSNILLQKAIKKYGV